MKKILLIIVVLFLSSETINAQEVIGGDITWTCINSGPDAGKYKFKLTLFNRCAQGALPLSQTITVYNNPSLSSISMLIDSEKDISPICYDPSQQLSCDSASPEATSKAIYYSSPTSLSGVPPANGWGFTWTSNSRNITSSNLSNSGGSGYTLRSIMYNYKNANKNVCHDNSPQFMESPTINYCTGYSFVLNNYAFDPDNDKVTHSWAVPMGTAATFPPTSAMTWQPGYSTSSPFPGTFHSPLNVPAALSTFNGEITFDTKVNISDRIYYSIKLVSVRDSVIISEVYREMMAVPKACPPTPTFPPFANTPPQVTFKESPGSPVNIPLPIIDTIFAGDTVNFHMTSIDFQFLPGLIGQTNYLYPLSSQFGTEFTSTSSGCEKPPCATLDTTNNGYTKSKDKWVGQFGVNTEFKWATDSSHGSEEGNWYHFHFYIQDDWCPNPGINLQTYSVLVFEEPDNYISGNVFNDINGNGIKDSIEANMQGILVRQTPPVYYTSSSSNGNYSLPAFSNTYSISAIPPRYYQTTSPTSGSHSVTTSGNGNFYTGKDFGLQAIPNINDLSIDLHSTFFQSPGNNTYYWLTVKNLGTTTLSGTIDLEFSNLLNFVTSYNPITSSTANSLTWTYSNLAPLTNLTQFITFKVDTSAVSGDSILVKAFANPIFGDTIPVDNKDSVLNFVLNSFDPNYKAVDPGRDLYIQEIKDQNFIYYTVHFQNTGTAPAIDVRVSDVIESSLDIESIEMISSSHDNKFRVDGRKITWIFNNINLPDSGSDFLGSQGFFKFRIIADSSLNIGDSITNAVNIFFDYNVPVFTEVVSHIVEEDTTVGINDNSTSRKLGGNNLSLYPNPTNGTVNLSLTTIIENEEVLIQLFSITGKEMIKSRGLIEQGQLTQSLDLNKLENGVYFVLISSDNISISSKLIKQ